MEIFISLGAEFHRDYNYVLDMPKNGLENCLAPMKKFPVASVPAQPDPAAAFGLICVFIFVYFVESVQ